MSFQFIEFRKEQNFAVITLNRPDVLNAINIQMRQEILSALDEALNNDEIRVVIFAGTGRAFCSGVDVKELKSRTPLEARRTVKLGGTEPFNTIAQYPKPTIAAINGYAVGGGCELALACDIRLASENAKLGQPEVLRGLIPGAGGTQRLPRLVGPGLAKELIFTGKMVEAKEAERIGLVNHVYSAEELMKAAEDLAITIAKNGPVALMLSKAAIDRGLDSDITTGLAYEKEASTIIHYTDDKQEGTAAFLEKREPKFKGR
ncbi:MAG: enoyl-CoA hydratase/isomerase family protein [Thaumarchaeota archaeon]|nr:enoyl-CoA hydratase/isomerase family protein [Nitrososphaerota archaeon]